MKNSECQLLANFCVQAINSPNLSYVDFTYLHSFLNPSHRGMLYIPVIPSKRLVLALVGIVGDDRQLGKVWIIARHLAQTLNLEELGNVINYLEEREQPWLSTSK